MCLSALMFCFGVPEFMAEANREHLLECVERKGTGGETQYLTLDYYERWIQGIEMLLIEKGLITQDELKNRFEKLSKEVG